MHKIFKGLAAALAFTSVVAASVPAEARRDSRWGYRGDHRGWDGDRGWRGDRHYRYDRGYRGYYGSRGYGPRGYYAPRYGYGYGGGYGYGYPRYRHYHNDDALIAGIAGLAIGAAIASSSDY